MIEIDQALYSKLSGGTALVTALGGTAIYAQEAPEGAALPFVVFNFAGGGREFINPSPLTNVVYYVTSYAATRAQAGTIAGLVDALLNGGSITVSGYTNFDTHGEEFLPIPVDHTNAAPVYGSGRVYRIRIDS